MMQTETDIVEAAVLTELEEAGGLTGSRYRVRLIEGDKLGSSGYYPATTLLRDGPKIFKKGIPMYLDHQTPEERELRPHGSVTTYAGELAEDAYYDGDGLYAEIEVFEHQRPLIKSLKDKIGISIRARGTSIVETINGKSVPVFKTLDLARSADFVVKAGAGGKIMSILESATEDSETTSEAKEGKQQMDEVLEELKAMRADFSARLTNLEEAAKPAKEEVVEESAIDYSKVLEIAEALGASELDAEGRARVLDLHRANSKPLADLITAEEAYVAKRSTAVEVEGVEESAEAEEAATTIALPSAWKKDKK